MPSLDKRVKKLEATAYAANFAKFTDSELDEYILTLDIGSQQWWDAVIARVQRHPSTIAIVPDCLANDETYCNAI